MSNKSIFALASAVCSCVIIVTAVAVFLVKPQSVATPDITSTVAPQALLDHAPIVPLVATRMTSPQLMPTPMAVLSQKENEDAHAGDMAGSMDTEMWFLPVRAEQFRVTARFGYHASETPYFTLLKAKNLLAASTTEGVFHSGVDLKTGSNAPVFAVAAGRVLTVAYSDLIGKHVSIELEGQAHSPHAVVRQVIYGHLNDIFVTEGQVITRGEVLGISGSTGKSIVGAHLHFEVRDDGHAIDPMPILRQAQQANVSNQSKLSLARSSTSPAGSGLAVKP